MVLLLPARWTDNDRAAYGPTSAFESKLTGISVARESRAKIVEVNKFFVVFQKNRIEVWVVGLWIMNQY